VSSNHWICVDVIHKVCSCPQTVGSASMCFILVWELQVSLVYSRFFFQLRLVALEKKEMEINLELRQELGHWIMHLYKENIY
jgi:hypothetical protein